MAVVAARVSVTTTATRLDASAPTDSVSGQRVTVYNAGSASVFLGGSGVLSTDGFELPAGGSYDEELSPGDELYGITASGTVICHVIRVGV